MDRQDHPSQLGDSAAEPFKVAYLVNQYPHVSHSFIRREIAALESRGVVVARFSIRASRVQHVDPADVEEQRKTRVLLGAGLLGLLFAAIAATARAPRDCLAAVRAATRLGRRSD
ncbi:MAG: hypothetical protein ABUR63_06490, partial [Verrucomicrobiota bacterium]